MANDEYLGCGDGGCVVERPKGMHTNGGCRCLMSLHPDERVRVRASFKRLRSALERATRERDESFDLNQRALRAFVPGLVSRDNMWGLEAREWRDDFKALLEKMSK